MVAVGGQNAMGACWWGPTEVMKTDRKTDRQTECNGCVLVEMDRAEERLI
jgi:hypothetical protein